jgi:hypothetical protein
VLLAVASTAHDFSDTTAPTLCTDGASDHPVLIYVPASGVSLYRDVALVSHIILLNKLAASKCTLL